MSVREMAAAAVLSVACAWGLAAEAVFQQTGSLSEQDAALADGRHVDWYKVPLTAGVRYLVSAESDEIDTSILLRFADGAQLANNDFQGSNPALAYTAVRSETVEVGVANSLDPEQGAYSVAVERIAAGRAVQAGQKISRSIGADSAGARGWKSDSLMLIGGKGDRLGVRVRSQELSPVVRIQNRAGYSDEIADEGEGASLSYVFPQQGQIEIVVRGSDPTEGGKYDLEIDRPSQARTLQAGASVEGKMGQGRDLYLLEGKRGRAVFVAASSDDFDPIIQVVDRLGRRASNDDYGGETTARLHHVFADDEPVAVAVLRTSDGQPGAYHLSVEASDFDASQYRGGDLGEISGGDVVSGHLSVTDLARQNRYVHRYTFTAAQDQVVRLELSSESFDAYLELVAPDGSVSSDDDSLGGYNALVQTICRDEGTYMVRVTTAADWETGFYELSFANRGDAEPLLEQEGSLDHRDSRDIGGRYYDVYTVEVEEGVSLTVEMISGELDSFLHVWDPNGEEIYSDDDGGGESNARVNVEGAAPGKWTIYATSNDRGQTGPYTLRVLAF